MNEDYFKRIFSRNLKKYMQLNNKEQIDIINDLGFNKSAVSTWCNGTRLPRMDKVDALAKYFSINRSDLIEETTVLQNQNNFYLSDNEIRHMEKYRAIDFSGKQFVDSVLDREYERYTAASGNIIPVAPPDSVPDAVRSSSEPTTIAAHFDGEEYTEKDLDTAKKFAAFAKTIKK